MNTIQLIGRWVREHELRYTQDGKAVLNNTIAVNRRFDKDKADFLRVVIFGKQAESTANFTSKGTQIGITGRVQTGSYEGQDGKKVYTTDVIADQVMFLEPKKDGQATQSNNQSTNQGDPFSGEPVDISSDDLPF